MHKRAILADRSPATDAIKMAGEPEPQPQTTALSKSNILNRGYRPTHTLPTAERFSATGRYGTCRPRHSGLMLAIRMSLVHFPPSCAIRFPRSADDPPLARPPRSRKRAIVPGSARAALTASLSLSMPATGVFLGAPRPSHELAS